ncbi:hypothetical protein [Candidatus Odyssella thessalonicensis]|uniref:hypothetical protein n=1 Tax=Candidatus Odyssella thessalonicensis TaxID=84647 RepID=UPI001584B92B|nr:hypothetical protein [Candidatus Odyssella thessalonicensis]
MFSLLFDSVLYSFYIHLPYGNSPHMLLPISDAWKRFPTMNGKSLAGIFNVSCQAAMLTVGGAQDS